MKYKMIKRMIPLCLLALSLHHEAAWSKGSSLHAAGCSLKTLAGSYSWDEETRTDYSKLGYSKFGQGWVFAVSVGREVNDGKGHITSGQMTINNTYDGKVKTETYTGVVEVRANCVGSYHITLADGTSGGGGVIYIDPKTRNFTLLDAYNIGTAKFVRDGN